MDRHASRAKNLTSNDCRVRFENIQTHIAAGRIGEALEDLAAIESDCGADDHVLRQLIIFYSQLGRHERSYACSKRLRMARPDINANFAFASAAISLGCLDEAEQQLDSIIEERPEEAEAYYTRSTLRTQTLKRNHVDELKSKLSELRSGHPAEVPLCYALGKELEDLGEYVAAFDSIARGAGARREKLSYNVKADTDALRGIAATFDKGWWDTVPFGVDANGPIVIVGLPRSGTTLVDRILGSHEDVTSLGEVNDFTYAVMRGGSSAKSKHELMKNIASADMHDLGDGYWAALKGYGEQATYLIDKTPGNFLYLGLIAKALPGARILHVHRHPMASGYAMYKSLFRMGYPFSYDLEMIAAYWLAYKALMAHWQTLFGDRILDVSYEDIIDDAETSSRRIVAHCGLKWSDACLRFHENTSPTATASAAQVRRPLYRSARDLWRRYEPQLAPLNDALIRAGARI